MKIWIFSLFLFLAKAHAGEAPNTFTVSQIVDDQVLLSRVVKQPNGELKVVEVIPARIDGPWTDAGAKVEFSANDLVAENLRTINHPKPAPFASAAKMNRLAEMNKEYDFDVKRENLCGNNVDRTQCTYTEPIYNFSLKYKHAF